MKDNFNSQLWIDYIHESRQQLIDFQNNIIIEILSNEKLTDSEKVLKIKELLATFKTEHQILLNKFHFIN